MMQQTKFKETEIGMIPEDWEVVKQEEIARFINGRAYSYNEFKDKGTPIVRIQNLTHKGNQVYSDLILPEEKYIENGDLIFAWSAVFSPYIWRGEKSIYHYHIWKIVCNMERLDKRFFYYKLKYISDKIANTGTGSIFTHITKEIMENYKISLPSLSEQSAIAKILSDLDSKIELNQQMNKTLEAIGLAIFKQWFVDFEFPNENGKPYKSSGGEMVDSELGEMPKRWKVGKLGDFVNLIKGVSYKSEELKDSDKALVTLKSINRGGGLNKNGFKEFIGKYKKEQEIIDGDIVVAHTDITQKAEVLGKPAIVRMIKEYNTLIASLDLSIVRPKDNTTNKPYLYYLLKSENFQNHAFGYANGTTVLHLSSRAIPEYLFAVPDKKLILTFGESIEKLLDKKKKSEAETENLILIRDSLIPKLMSGKIIIPVEVG